MSVKFKINTKKLMEAFDDFSDAIEPLVEEEIRKHLENVRDLALAMKPWKDQTGSLRAGHVIVKEQDGWILKADPRINPQKGKVVTEDYAPILEYGGWAWFYPAVFALEEELITNIRRKLTKTITSIFVRGGKVVKVKRYAAGVVIEGKKVGGRFAPNE